MQALRWLMRLNQELAGLTRGMFPTGETFPGLDDKRYWVRRTNNGLACYLKHHHDETLEEVEPNSPVDIPLGLGPAVRPPARTGQPAKSAC